MSKKRKSSDDLGKYQSLPKDHYNIEEDLTISWLEKMKKEGLIVEDTMRGCIAFMKRNLLVLGVGTINVKGYQGSNGTVSYNSNTVLTECCGCDALFTQNGEYTSGCDNCTSQCYDCALGGEDHECQRGAKIK